MEPMVFVHFERQTVGSCARGWRRQAGPPRVAWTHNTLSLCTIFFSIFYLKVMFASCFIYRRVRYHTDDGDRTGWRAARTHSGGAEQQRWQTNFALCVHDILSQPAAGCRLPRRRRQTEFRSRLFFYPCAVPAATDPFSPLAALDEWASVVEAMEQSFTFSLRLKTIVSAHSSRSTTHGRFDFSY